MNPKRLKPRHFIFKLPKVKGKERTVKAAREKQLVIYSGTPLILVSKIFNRNFVGQKSWHNTKY